MENKENERCSNCAYYPFCKKCGGPLAWCENWKKRKIGGAEWENKKIY